MAKKDLFPKTKEETENKNWLEEYEGELTVDVYQTPDDIVIKSTVAGVKPEDISVSIADDTITIRGERKKEEKVEKENYYYQECYWGKFSRSIALPQAIDANKIKANIKDGILTITLPKLSKSRAKIIKVETK